MNKKQLIESLKAEGFGDEVLKAFEKVKREDFIPLEFRESAYEDIPLPIGLGQTISQPYTIAFMLNLLELDNKLKTINNQKLKTDKREKSSERDNDNRTTNNLKILEVGSGSGYVLALINEISKSSKIFGIERLEGLVEKSERILRNEKNIKIVCGDGIGGLSEYAPYDRILISASASKIPRHLYSQLSENGIIVASVQNSIFQIRKEKGRIIEKEYPGFIFVPLVED